MKRLLLIGGPMGVGKSVVCAELMSRLQPGVYLDGDWCWNMYPFSVTQETAAMVMDNVCAVLGRFLACPELDNVVFGWVMHRQEIIDAICARLPLEGVQVYRMSLVASQQVLRDRLVRDIARGKRRGEVISRSLSYLPCYEKLDTWKLDTDRCTPRQAAAMILHQLEQSEGIVLPAATGKDRGRCYSWPYTEE